jgi:hypothetical protein|nr:hypothetical protein [Allomuricauda sp.]
MSTNNKLNLEKFRVAKLNHPEYIVGGGDGDGDGTQTGDDGKKCMLTSIVKE